MFRHGIIRDYRISCLTPEFGFIGFLFSKWLASSYSLDNSCLFITDFFSEKAVLRSFSLVYHDFHRFAKSAQRI